MELFLKLVQDCSPYGCLCTLSPSYLLKDNMRKVMCIRDLIICKCFVNSIRLFNFGVGNWGIYA